MGTDSVSAEIAAAPFEDLIGTVESRESTLPDLQTRVC